MSPGRRIAVLVTGAEEVASRLRRRLAPLPVSRSPEELLGHLATDGTTGFDLVFVLLAPDDDPAGPDLGGVHGHAEVIAGIVLTEQDGGGAAVSTSRVAALREVADLVLWSPDETLVDDLCQAYG